MTIRVVVADDQELVRSGFAMIVDVQPDMEVVGEAADGAEAVALAGRVRPDVVLMDVRMPRLDGIEATRQILAGAAGDPPTRVVILTTFDLDEYVFQALPPFWPRPRQPAGSCSRTCGARTCSTRCGWSRPVRPCWRRRSPAG